MDVESFLKSSIEWVFYLTVGLVAFLFLSVVPIIYLGDDKAKRNSSSDDIGKDGFSEQTLEYSAVIHDLQERKILGISGLEDASKADDHVQTEPKGESFDNDNVGGNCNDHFSGVLEELEEKKIICAGGDHSGDDVEEHVIDECSERPNICKINEEQEGPVAETPVVLNHGEEFGAAGEAKSKEVVGSGVLDGDEENREEGSNESVMNEGNHEEDEEALLDDWEGIERTELEKRFGAAVAFVGSKSNADRIHSDVRMQLYGLHRVAIVGPCHEPQPMALKFSARAMWNAWQRLGNMSREMAMEQYMILLAKSIPEWEVDDVSSSVAFQNFLPSITSIRSKQILLVGGNISALFVYLFACGKVNDGNKSSDACSSSRQG